MKQKFIIASAALLVTAATTHTVAADDATAVSASSSSSADAASTEPDAYTGPEPEIETVPDGVILDVRPTKSDDSASVFDDDQGFGNSQVHVETRFLEVEETNIEEIGVDFDTDFSDSAPSANINEPLDPIESELRNRSETMFDEAIKDSGQAAPTFGGFEPNYFQRLTNSIVAIPEGNAGSITGYQADYLPIDDMTDDDPGNAFTNLDSTTIQNSGVSRQGGRPAALTGQDEFAGKSLEILELEQSVCELQAMAARMEIGHIIQQHGDEPGDWDDDTLAAHDNASSRLVGNEAYCKRLEARISAMKGADSAAVE